MKKITLLLILTIIFSCKERDKSNTNKKDRIETNSVQSNQGLNNNFKPNYEYKDLYKMRPYIIKGLKDKGYKIPSTSFFQKRILEISNIDITKEEYDDQSFGKYNTSAIVLRDLNILLPVDIETYAKVNDEYINHIIDYNNMVIYDQVTAVLLLDNYGQGCNIYSYIAGTGYTGNEKFIIKVLNKFKNYSPEGKAKGLEELLLGYTNQGNIVPHGPFRFDMLKLIENIAQV